MFAPMSLLYRPLESITAVDLQTLIDNGVRESLYIEYKTEVFDKRDKDKRLQFLGSVSGFANASGGDLLIGVEAKDAIPMSLPGIDNAAADGEILRVKAVIGSGIQPFMPVQFHSVPLPNGRTVIIIRIPQSWNPPHGIAENGHYQFLKRHAAGRDPMTLAELRASFTLASGAVERMRSFRENRLERMNARNEPYYRSMPAAVLHLVPFSSVIGNVSVNLSNTSEMRNMSLHKREGRYIQTAPMRYNLEGVLMQQTDGFRWHSQIFRDGSIELGMSLNFGDSGPASFVHAWSLQATLANLIPRFLRLQDTLGGTPPISVMLTIINVSGLKMGIGEGMMNNKISDHAFDRETVGLPDVVASDATTPATELLKPVFDALWNAAGMEKCDFYRNGQWDIDPSWLDDPQ